MNRIKESIPEAKMLKKVQLYLLEKSTSWALTLNHKIKGSSDFRFKWRKYTQTSMKRLRVAYSNGYQIM